MHAYTSFENRTTAFSAMAVIAVLLAIGANWVNEQVGIGPPWLVSPPAVAAVYGLLYQLMDRVAWKWRVARRLGLSIVPDIEGTYEGHLVSSYENTTVPVRICIDQTWTQLAVRFNVITPGTSTSYSVNAALARTGHAHARLTYTYKNQPRPGVADSDMHDHDGTAEITIDVANGNAEGRYFNFRGRQGTLTLRRIPQPEASQ